jgi:hypothetical protein
MKQKNTLIMTILLFLFVLIWIGESIYSSANSSTISEEVNQEISPIDPTFDTKTVNDLKSREKISPSLDLRNVVPTPIALPALQKTTNASREGKLSPQ